MKAALKALLYMMVVLVLIVFGLIIYKDQIIQPNWHVEHNAVRSNSHPLAGFWESGGCSGEWGAGNRSGWRWAVLHFFLWPWWVL
ncbi:hypothetical protein [Alcanivorax sp.]|uniref:hypothetical protein n=1 Tax=Alcanivorax sp. TaxID=1872427 RepID=UPI0025C3B30B|nr:hypothetical protein [Alcanivorax sp.]